MCLTASLVGRSCAFSIPRGHHILALSPVPGLSASVDQQPEVFGLD